MLDFEEISRKTVFAICKFLAIYRTVIIAFLLEMLHEIGFIEIGFISSN